MIQQSTMNKEKDVLIMRVTDSKPSHISTYINHPNNTVHINPLKGLLGRYSILSEDCRQLLICDVFLYDYTK